MIFSKIPAEVLHSYQNLGPVLTLDAIDMGLINKTFLVKTTKLKYILQEISPIFSTAIHDDSEAICMFLEKTGIKVPRIIRTDNQKLFLDYNGRIFRALKYIEGQSFHKICSPKMANEAGKILGQFHLALMPLQYDYLSKRNHGGDYVFHAQNLAKALKAHIDHDYFSVVEPLALSMLAELNKVSLGLLTTPRHVHGDPKISNILFNNNDEAICLIDFDTLAKTGWSLELADAMRSWCNKNNEDVLTAEVDLKTAELAILGYGEFMANKITTAEIGQFISHTQAISLCLAIRYLSDVLNENFWAYDNLTYERPAEHNMLRAQAMFNLFRQFQKNENLLRPMAENILL